MNQIYKPPILLKNGHVATLYPYFFRQAPVIAFSRDRISTPDDDFLDLDWLHNKKTQDLVILSHGLEANSNAAYIRAMAKHLFDRGPSILAWNCRSCSGELNLKHFFYHSGISKDLKTVIGHVVENYSFKNIYLIGFSMGGNITLKYLGEEGANTPGQIKRAACFSVPLDLESCCDKMNRGPSKIYEKNFLISLKKKLLEKKEILHKHGFNTDNLSSIKTLKEYDAFFTAPLHGFKNVRDYYEKSSSLPLLGQIKTPTLIVNALNDPILGNKCFPHKKMLANPYITFETPKDGGHVGFLMDLRGARAWTEQRAEKFIFEGQATPKLH